MIKKMWIALVRFGFRLLYNELAWTYDAVSWLVSLGEWHKWQQSAMPFLQGPHILEIGHGPGHMLVALQKAGYTVVGVDLSSNMGRLARRRLRRAKLPSGLVRAKVQQLPFSTAVFDSVLSTFPTDYIVDPATLKTIYRLLKPNGRLVVVPEGHLTGQGSLHRFIDFLFRITGQRNGPFGVKEDNGCPQPSPWDPFHRRFSAAGFVLTIEEIKLQRSAATLLIAEKTVNPGAATVSNRNLNSPS